jgi:hypothetical protein
MGVSRTFVAGASSNGAACSTQRPSGSVIGERRVVVLAARLGDPRRDPEVLGGVLVAVTGIQLATDPQLDLDVDAAEALQLVAAERPEQDREQVRVGVDRRAQLGLGQRGVRVVDRAATEDARRVLVAALAIAELAQPHPPGQPAIERRIGDQRAHLGRHELCEQLDRLDGLGEIDVDELVRRLGVQREDAQIDDDVRILELAACREETRQRDRLHHHVPLMPSVGRIGKLVTGELLRNR